jgi:hypothetical protein
LLLWRAGWQTTAPRTTACCSSRFKLTANSSQCRIAYVVPPHSAMLCSSIAHAYRCTAPAATTTQLSLAASAAVKQKHCYSLANRVTSVPNPSIAFYILIQHTMVL